jgi:hypothetical protein
VLFAWPIVPHDTDLFYHLNFGRRIAESGAIPSTAWYSYVQTRPGAVDYYWLSQLAFYLVHHAFGVVGLIALRALLFVTLAAVLFWTASRSELGRASRTWAVVVVVVALLLVLERFNTVRPHMFSYLLLAASIALIEQRGRAAFALVGVSVLWANLHGIEYPVLLLVLLGALVGRVGDLRSQATRGFPLLLCAAGLCVLANPVGVRLLAVPFTPLGLVGQAIFELQPVHVADLTSFSVESLVPTWSALRALMLAFAAVSCIASMGRRTLALRHLLWLAGGIYLLLHAERFSAELTLLALPAVLGSTWLAELRAPLGSRPFRALLLMSLAALAVTRVLQVTHGPWRYPLAESFLPKGTATLLRAHAPAGRVLHHPNYGGYLEWTLGEHFQIGADLQTPFLFSGERVLEQSSAFADARALRAAASKSRADYVLVPWPKVALVEAGIADAYAAVGFDDAVVAYAHRQRCAQFVSRFELRALSPGKLDRLLHELLSTGEVDAAEPELARLASIDDQVAVVRAAQAVVAKQNGAPTLARAHAKAAVALAPGHLEALRIAGEISLSAGAAPEAFRYFKRGLERLSVSDAPPLTRRHLAWGAARALAQLGRAREAYALTLPVFGDLTSASVSADDLTLLSAAARDAGEDAAAHTLEHLAASRSGHGP